MRKSKRCERLLLACVFLLLRQVSAFIRNDGVIQLSHDFWNPDKGAITRELECSRPDFYICEEPPESEPFDSVKLCNYRNVLYTEQIYRWVSGRGCLLYTPDFLYVNSTNTINLNSACLYGTMYAPCVEMIKPDGTCGCYPFDPSFPEVVALVEEALIASAHGRWERCYQAAADCCSDIMTNADAMAENYCGSTFDGWACWDNAPAGSVATQVCPEFAYTNTGPDCHHFSTKNCTEAAIWEIQTDYSTCSITPRLVRRNRYYIWTLAISTVVCVPAIFVFFFYKRLRLTRVALHRNLLIAIVMRNILVIVTRTEIYLDELTSAGDTSMSLHEWPCRVLAVLERVCVNLVFVCMLVEGVYLHRLICAVFKKEYNIRLLYGIGFAIAVVPVAAWATVMALFDDHSCWLVYTVPYVQWTLDGPRITILLANTVLFLDILRVLLTKIRNSENANQLSTTKATLFLMPLFGVQFLLTAYRPNTTSCAVEQGYYIFTYTMEAIQGVIVAILYCYANKEVHNLITITYKKTENAVVSRVRRDSNYRRSTLGGDFLNRRETCSTALDPSPNFTEEAQEPPKPNVFTREEISVPNLKYPSLLDPIAECGFYNEGFYCSEVDNDSGYIPRNNNDETNSKTSTGKTDDTIECQDWIKCVSSPSSSIYENSLNEYEIRYLEEKKKKENDKEPNNNSKLSTRHNNLAIHNDVSNDVDNFSFSNFEIPGSVDDINGSQLFDQIISEVVRKVSVDATSKDGVVLNPNALSPNRPESERIMFVDE